MVDFVVCFGVWWDLSENSEPAGNGAHLDSKFLGG